jgi:hypothetical protein
MLNIEMGDYMKAREYIEHQYLPWILFLDKKDTIKQLIDRKEGYLFELYNHISKEFKALERYELFMFRVQFSKQILPIGMSEIITIKTPQVFSSGDCAYIFIVYNDSNLIYYTVDYVLEDMFQVRKYYNKKQVVIANVSSDLKEIMNAITTNLMEF